MRWTSFLIEDYRAMKEAACRMMSQESRGSRYIVNKRGRRAYISTPVADFGDISTVMVTIGHDLRILIAEQLRRASLCL